MEEELTREEKLALPAQVRLDMTDAPTLNGTPPIDDPRVYGMTDEEAIEWNEKKALGLVGKPTKEDIEYERRMMYWEKSDPLFFSWQRGESTEQEWLDAVQAVKDQLPYPEQ